VIPPDATGQTLSGRRSSVQNAALGPEPPAWRRAQVDNAVSCRELQFSDHGAGMQVIAANQSQPPTAHVDAVVVLTCKNGVHGDGRT
jgi:hypothetical protein